MRSDTRRAPQWFYFGPWAFSIDAAQALIADRPRQTDHIDVVQWARAYGLTSIDDPDPRTVSLIGPTRDGLNRAHAMTTDLSEPVIVALLDVDGDPAPLLIDGVHRLYRACKEYEPQLPAYLLTVQETRQVRHSLILRGHGRFPGPAERSREK